MNAGNIPSPVVLKNRGVPVDVHKVERVVDPDDPTAVAWEPVFDANDEPVFEKRWVRFTNDVLAAVEEEFGSLFGWKAAMEGEVQRDEDGEPVFENGAPVYVRPPRRAKVILFTLARMWGWSEDRVGRAMIVGSQEYDAAVGAALSMANGLDPTIAADVLRTGIQAAADRVQAVNAEATILIAEAKAAAEAEAAGTDESLTPGGDGGVSGSPSADPTPSSGSQAPSRSSTSSESGPTSTEPLALAAVGPGNSSAP